MKSSTLFQLSGVAAIIAGVAYLTDTILDFTHPGNLLGVGLWVSLFGLHGLTGLFLRQREPGGILNIIGYILNFTGLSALIGVVFVNNFIVPKLDAGINQALFSGPTLAAFITVGVVYLSGVLVFGTAIWRNGIFSRPATALYMLGSIPVALPPVFSAHIVTIGGVLISVSLIWFGCQLWQENKTTFNLAADAV